jgi:prepilin-type N-terminal cleavage/methylation domain-containing protein
LGPLFRAGRTSHRSLGGFTLIELMIVVALIAIATAVASLALRDPAAAKLENEAARLVALLESDFRRAGSRSPNRPTAADSVSSACPPTSRCRRIGSTRTRPPR